MANLRFSLEVLVASLERVAEKSLDLIFHRGFEFDELRRVGVTDGASGLSLCRAAYVAKYVTT